MKRLHDLYHVTTAPAHTRTIITTPHYGKAIDYAKAEHQRTGQRMIVWSAMNCRQLVMIPAPEARPAWYRRLMRSGRAPPRQAPPAASPRTAGGRKCGKRPKAGSVPHIAMSRTWARLLWQEGGPVGSSRPQTHRA